ncbi:MAG: aspartyl-tRNA(Asn)/glutamyl-tRNA (Gln) amidotransferase subunit B [Microgenomates group bacterium Gr01-1014_7]|nr:MAG: aspartyl-tRNA(Asn)/glutamyl-tRNA (Gln) amidotransferase subunit B [Microgenomates group bacterium Gr01-1014_7]
MNYTPVIGLEVHVELKTKSKMFCGCSADYFGKEPNTHTCPVCLGLPGALPVPNKKAIEWCVMIGLALNCTTPLFSKFDRKNYFYPDLPKGYQISQYDQPLCINGFITLSNGKKIRIRRVHMEEDTGKLTHVGNESLIDFNRSGVPLVEIVTEPDFESSIEVVEYLKKLQQIVRFLGVSNADMEKGDMRLEPNISLKMTNELPKYKVEVKNINSFRFVGKAIEYEIKRQTEILDRGDMPEQETRGWNDEKNITVSQRSKEEAHDYRYFPEPDLPPIRFTEDQISDIRNRIPELPDEKLARFQKEYQLNKSQAVILTETKEIADYFEKTVKPGKVDPIQIANYIINKKIDINKVSSEEVIAQVAGKTSGIIADEGELGKLVKEAIDENPKAVADFKSGKENALQVLIGAVMKKTAGKADAEKARKILTKLLKRGLFPAFKVR